VASLEKKRERLATLIEKRDKMNESIKTIQADIARQESQEIMKTINELNLTPDEARILLQKAKSTALKEAVPQVSLQDES